MNLPNDLITQIANGDCDVFVGAGLSIGAGLPSWDNLLYKMQAWGEQHNVKNLPMEESIKKCIEKGSHLMVAELLQG